MIVILGWVFLGYLAIGLVMSIIVVWHDEIRPIIHYEERKLTVDFKRLDPKELAVMTFCIIFGWPAVLIMEFA
ncbi:MAG: hypothetical protein Q7R75_01040 [bacterium]|nr:hypothetical protein [bacterium]